MNQAEQEFLDLFQTIAIQEHRYKVFRDWVTMAAIALNNSIHKDPDLEEEYLHLIRAYQKDDQLKLTHLLALLVMALEEGIQDVLGNVYMQLDLGSKHVGQFFTPYSVSLAMAKLTFEPPLTQSNLPITIHEPACGSGSMILAL